MREVAIELLKRSAVSQTVLGGLIINRTTLVADFL